MSVSVVFSPSLTIAMNQIVNGLEWGNGSVIYISPYEHNAVARTIHKLASEKNILVKLLPINADTYEIDIEKMKYEFSKDKPDAVFCTHVSNVTGYILPVKEIFETAKESGAITILDSAQSLGLVSIDIRQLEVDIIAFAGHKTLYGPFGIGGFINIKNVPLKVYITGGTGSDSLNPEMPNGMEAKYEAASGNITAIAGLNAALEELDVGQLANYERELTEYLIGKLKEVDGIKLFLPADLKRHVGIVSFIIKGMNSEDVGTILDEDFDIAVRTGYHCAPYIHEYLGDKNSVGTVRVGLGRFNTREQIDKFVEAIYELL